MFRRLNQKLQEDVGTKVYEREAFKADVVDETGLTGNRLGGGCPFYTPLRTAVLTPVDTH
jgi:hypothetical protein